MLLQELLRQFCILAYVLMLIRDQKAWSTELQTEELLLLKPHRSRLSIII
jgi:hypothetical protein